MSKKARDRGPTRSWREVLLSMLTWRRGFPSWALSDFGEKLRILVARELLPSAYTFLENSANEITDPIPDRIRSHQ